MVDIAIQNVGPITEAEFHLDECGLWVLGGEAGAGKTTTLRMVQLGVDGRADGGVPTKRDGAKSGNAKIGGKKITISKLTRHEGELQFDGVGDFDIGGLHTPRFLDAATRDKHRIRALVRLANVAPDSSLFHELLGGREAFDAVVDADSIKTDDMVEMAGKVKRCIEKAAQASEKQGEMARARMAAQAEQCNGVAVDAPHDAKALQAALVSAIEAKTRIGQQRADALETIRKADEARTKLEAAEVGATTVADASAALEEASFTEARAAQMVADLERQLTDAKNNLSLATSKVMSATQSLVAAKRHSELTSGWRADIDAAAGITCPTEAAVAEAVAAVDAANAAVELGGKVRDAIAAKAEAARYASVAKDHETAADRFRKAAAATQDVLSDALSGIPNCPLKVWNDPDGNARLVLETDRSEREPFDELSDGERYDVLIPMLARNGRIIVLSQAAFGELSPTIRGRVHELARQRGCFVLTAQADSGPLRAQLYQPDTAEVAA